MRKLIAIFLFAVCAHAETLQGVLDAVFRQTIDAVNPPAIVIQAKDQASPKTIYSVRFCFFNTLQTDGFCPPGTTNSVTLVADQAPPVNLNHGTGNQVVYVPGTIGGINLTDGGLHYFCAYVISKIADDEVHDLAVDQTLTSPNAKCTGFPIQYDKAHVNLMPTWTPNLASSSPASASEFAVIANTSDAESVGSTGTVVCASGTTANGTTAIKNDGFAGIWVEKHKVPCDQVYEISMPTAEPISVTAFNAVAQTVLNSIPASIQYQVAAWATPSYLMGGNGRFYGMAGWLTMYGTTRGTEPTVRACVDKTTGIGFGPQNPWFNSGTNATPFTSNQVRPTIMGAAGACTGCTTAINYTPKATWKASPSTFSAIVAAAESGIGSSPSGVLAQSAWSDPTRAGFQVQTAPAALGNAVSPKFSYSLLGTFAKPCSGMISSGCGSETGIMSEFLARATWDYSSNFSFVAGVGFVSSMTSTAASFAGTTQTPLVSSFFQGTGGVTGTHPAVVAGGFAVEPCESLPQKGLDPTLFLQYESVGWDLLQTFWKAQRDPWAINLWGEPLAQPFPALP